MQHRRHEPGETLALPDPAQACGAVAIEAILLVASIFGVERAGQHHDIGDRQVQALGAGGRHDVGRVAGDEQAAVLHRFTHERAQRDDAFLEDPALCQLPAIIGVEARVQFVPDAPVRPCRDIVGWIALDIHALHVRRPCAEQGEAFSLVGVNEFVPRQRRFGQDAEPAEWVDLLILSAMRAGNGCAAGTMKAVGADDVVAMQRLKLAGSSATKID